MKIGIVAVGYNRPDSMKKLLKSVCNAVYDSDNVDLIVSIDKGERQNEIVRVAESCNWEYGQKKIRTFSERQGLRKHIIQCGDLTQEYDAVVVLEDDLIVSRWFFYYVKETIVRYGSNEQIAGISLYKHYMHPGVHRPFEPDNNGCDVFFMQFAMSWGQCWTKNMWKRFKQWYMQNETKDLSEGGVIPEYIAAWNNQSWLKYYMRYVAETNKFFVYPYISLATNASDLGEHCKIPNNDFQVPILNGKMEYRLPDLNDAVKYDVFFERIGLSVFPELDGEVLLDLYGNRSNYSGYKYCISTKSLPYKTIRQIKLRYRPIELNCVMAEDGDGAALYDLQSSYRLNKINNNIITRYDVRSIHWKRLLQLGINGFIEAVSNKIKRSK